MMFNVVLFSSVEMDKLVVVFVRSVWSLELVVWRLWFRLVLVWLSLVSF